jgi:acyl dehydratase
VAPVFPGDTLRFAGEVVTVGGGIAELVLTASRGDEPVIRATARVAVSHG